MKQRKKLQHLDLFSGIGGFSLGLESAGLAKTVAFCDTDNFCQEVLKKHWPKVPIFSDVKELTYEKLKTNGINKIDIITGGYPCQPFSVAGRKKGEEDPRHVWPEYFRLIKELRPTWVIGENVGGHIKLGLDSVLSDLESEGYSTRTFSISASSIGANHKRERVWILANSKSCNRNEYETDREHGKIETQKIFGNGNGLSGVSSRWEIEPDVGRVAHGIPNTMDRLKSLGNSVVPQIPYLIADCIRRIEGL
jgi:DNA (cytosine-5)-methyltransferase 1